MKQTKENVNSNIYNMIPYKVFYPFFDKVPKDEIDNLYKFMKLQRTYAIFQRESITENRFKQLNDFLVSLDKSKYIAFNTDIIDTWQQQHFFKELTNLINSIDFKLLNNKERSGIVEEQKRLHNELNIN